MRLLICVLCLVTILVSDTAFGRGRSRGRRSGGGNTSASLNAPVDDSPVYQIENQLVEAVNAERTSRGLRALILDHSLLRTTRQHCGWMANARNMIHSAFNRAENIAMGQRDVKDVMKSWMNSSGHRANILNPGYTKIGIAGYASEGGTPYWCQQFE